MVESIIGLSRQAPTFPCSDADDPDVSPRSGQQPRRRVRNLSLVGADLPARIRTAAFALLGLTTAAALGLVLLFAQSTLPIPSLGPVTPPLPGQQGVHGGISLGPAGASQTALGTAGSGIAPRFAASTALTSTSSSPSATSLAAGGFGTRGTPAGDGGVEATAGGGTSISGNDPEVPAVQPQPTAVSPGGGPGSAPVGGEAGPTTTPVAEPVSTPPPSEPSVPTAEPPVVEPELPQPPVEEIPEGESPEEPPVVEPPAEEDGEGGFLEAVGRSRGAL
jgi:hypothetical protein